METREDMDEALKSEIGRASTRLADWCRQDALPLWAEKGRNPDGGFYEHLTADGVADTAAPVRVRVHARQIYVFSHAACLDWYEKAQTVADEGKAFLLQRGLTNTSLAPPRFGGMGYVQSPSYSLSDDHTDTYSIAFFLLAMSWHHRATGELDSLDWACSALEFLDEHLASPHGGWVEGMPATLPRRQNPHMHLIEAFMALFEATGEARFLERAGDVFRLFETRFFDEKNGVLREFFTGDWQYCANKGHLIEPGHMMEWCWLLHRYQTLSGHDTSAYVRRLHDEAAGRGLNETTGLLFDCCSLEGPPPAPTHRCWPLTEHIKAEMSLARLGDPDAARMVPLLTDRLFSTYLSPGTRGGWLDQVDAQGRLISRFMPSSTFYHLIGLAAEMQTFAGEMAAGKAAPAPLGR